MKIEALRNRAKRECELYFDLKSLEEVGDTELRNYVVEIVIDNLDKMLYKKFNDVINNLPDKEKINLFITSILENYASTSFKNLFKDGITTIKEQKKRSLKITRIDPRTVRQFFKGKVVPNEKTLDFFSVFVRFGGWNNFTFEKDEQQETISNSNNITSATLNQNHHVSGAIIINEEFIQKINNGKSFTMAEFYTAKQNEDCQWFGIIQGWDVERSIFKKTKNEIKEIFGTNRTYKVSFVIGGNGGVGKSTFLRRLAIDLSYEKELKVIWLNDNQVDNFVENGIKTIEKNKEINFLVIIEDWYRMFDGRDFYFIKSFLDNCNRIQNIRLIIGDRIIRGKQYLQYLNNDILPRVLTSNENRHIIEKIITNYPEWKTISQKLFEDKKSYESSLFLLLFIIARISKEENNNHSYDLSEPKTAFINIIESDIKFISQKYIGLATMLYYWACVYSQFKIFITYETFLKLADFYNKNNDISRFFIRWNADDEFLERMKIYIHRGFSIENKNMDFVLFNHDTLADSGLSKINYALCEKFGDKVKLDLLDFISQNGDDATASMYLSSLLSTGEDLFINKEEKLKHINKLLDNNNTHRHYLSHLSSLLTTKDERNEYIKLLEEKGISDTVATLIMF